jgi:excisionase family DNA binding protein
METHTALLHPVPVVMQMLSIGRTTFYKLVDTGEIKLLKIGNKSLVADSNVREIVASRLEKAS